MAKLVINDSVVVDYTDDGWDEFEKWLDGTYANLTYTWVDEGPAYAIVAPDGGVFRVLHINKADAGAFEASYKTNSPVSTWLGSTAPTVGQKAMASSVPVSISSDQSAVPISAASLPLPSGATTEATLDDIRDQLITDDVAIPAGTKGLVGIGESVTTAGNSDYLNTKDDPDVTTHKRLLTETDFKPGITLQVTSGASSSTAAVVSFLKDSGGSGTEDMIVDGSTVSVKYEYNADATDDIKLSSLRLVMSATLLDFTGAFGKGGGILTNGVSVDIVANNGAFSTQLVELKRNEDFWRLLSTDAFSDGGSTVAATLVFGANVQLIAGTSDEVSVTINDDLTSGARGLNYLTATLYGDKL